MRLAPQQVKPSPTLQFGESIQQDPPQHLGATVDVWHCHQPFTQPCLLQCKPVGLAGGHSVSPGAAEANKLVRPASRGLLPPPAEQAGLLRPAGLLPSSSGLLPSSPQRGYSGAIGILESYMGERKSLISLYSLGINKTSHVPPAGHYLRGRGLVRGPVLGPGRELGEVLTAALRGSAARR